MITKLRVALPLAAAFLSLSGAANAVVVPGVYDTGLGVGGAALGAGNGQVDANYTITATDAPGVMIGASALTYYNPAYLQDGPSSRIVNSTGTDAGTNGTSTTFATTFSLVGYNSMNATLSGQALFDNFGEIFLNGNQVGGTITGFASLSPFGTNSNFFLAGLNTLSFVLHNTGGPEGFQVAGLTVTAEALPGVGGVPEPASWALMMVGFGLVGATMRKRQTVSHVTA